MKQTLIKSAGRIGYAALVVATLAVVGAQFFLQSNGIVANLMAQLY